MKHKRALAYHPQSNGQAKVSNHELKRILEKTINTNKTHYEWICTMGIHNRVQESYRDVPLPVNFWESMPFVSGDSAQSSLGYKEVKL